MPNPEKVAASLTKAQRKVLLAYPDDVPVNIGGKVVMTRSWVKASEIGAHGSTMAALQTFGGVDPKTFLAGPCLATPDWSREGCHWKLTDLGYAVRAHLLKGNPDNGE